MTVVVTTRFNTETYIENLKYRNKKKIRCVYCSPCKVSGKIHTDEFMLVIEMNNTLNRIEGIGLIRNNFDSKKYFNIYNEKNFNRYTYIGKYFISRNNLKLINEPFVLSLDKYLFTGRNHSKRGTGITLLPKKLHKIAVTENNNIHDIDIKKTLVQIFKQYYMK